ASAAPPSVASAAESSVAGRPGACGVEAVRMLLPAGWGRRPALRLREAPHASSSEPAPRPSAGRPPRHGGAVSFKSIFLATVAALSTLALGAAAALVLLTSSIHRVADSLAVAMQGMHLVEELQVQLLTHWVMSERLTVLRPDQV